MFDPPAGEMHAHAGAVLLDALEIPAEVVVRGVDGLAQQSLQPIPGGQDLRQAFLCNHVPGTVQRYTPLDLDAEIVGVGAAASKRLQQLRVRGDAGATPNQLDRRTLIDVGIPADLPQECGGEQARHRTTDDDGAALA